MYTSLIISIPFQYKRLSNRITVRRVFRRSWRDGVRPVGIRVSANRHTTWNWRGPILFAIRSQIEIYTYLFNVVGVVVKTTLLGAVETIPSTGPSKQESP